MRYCARMSAGVIQRGGVVLLLVLGCGPGSPAATASAGTTGGESSEGQGSTSTSGTSSTGSTGSTSSTSPTTGAPGGSTVDSCGFICMPDLGPSPLRCDIFAQDCPDGEKCSFAGTDGGFWDTEFCVPVAGDGGLGEPCTVLGAMTSGHDDCAPGFICFNLVGEAGTCSALCSGSWRAPGCPPGTAMNISNELCICTPNCDPVAQGCPDGQVCALNFDELGFVCTTNVPDGEHPPGSACEFLNVCDAGSWCVEQPVFPHPNCADPTSGCCAPFCDLSQGTADNPVCAPFVADLPGVECVSFYAPDLAPPGLESVGVCGLP